MTRNNSRKPEPPPVDVDKVVSGMSTEFLQCRDFNHSWRPFTAEWVADERSFRVQLRCARCKAKRIRYIGQNGQLISSHYEYVDGYLIKGLGRLTGTDRDYLRLQSVMRILPDDAMAEG